MNEMQLISIKDLVNQTVQTIQTRRKDLMPYVLLMLAVYLVQALLLTVVISPIGLLSTLITVIVSVVATLGSMGIIYMLGKNVDFNTSLNWLKVNYAKLLKFIIVYLFLIYGSMGLFYFPVIFFGIFFMFSTYIFVLEDTTITQALLKSREYTRNIGFSLLWRLLALVALVMVTVFAVYIVVGLLSIFIKGAFLTQFVTYILNAFIIPVGLVYGLNLYQNVKSVKGEVSTEGKSLTMYVVISAIGMLLLIAAIGVGGLFASRFPQTFKQGVGNEYTYQYTN